MAKMGKMLKDLQRLKTDMMNAQEDLAEKSVEASSGGGVVTCLVNGKQEVLEINIKPEAVDLEDLEMLEDLVLAAVNQGITKSKEMIETELGKLTGGLNLPGLGDMF